jgi:hypothetical protein
MVENTPGRPNHDLDTAPQLFGLLAKWFSTVDRNAIRSAAFG